MPEQRPVDPVVLSGARGGSNAELLRDLSIAATAAAGDVDASLELAADWTDQLPGVEEDPALLWSALATLGAADLTTARVVEPHLDACDILRQAGWCEPVGRDRWGVYAAEGPGTRLTASGPPWRVDGQKPWCSLADRVDRALVTAWLPDGERGLFAIELKEPGVSIGDDPWIPKGLSAVRSPTLELDQVATDPVGPPGWYLNRPGFAWGGVGVAAVWFGGAVGVARRLAAQRERRSPDQIGDLLLGRADLALYAARQCLEHAAREVGDDRSDATVTSARTRAIVHDAAETVMRAAAHGLGPSPLVREVDHAQRVADLEVYLRQHHAERDVAALGHRLGTHPW